MKKYEIEKFKIFATTHEKIRNRKIPDKKMEILGIFPVQSKKHIAISRLFGNYGKIVVQ